MILLCFVLHNITQIQGGKYIDYENLLDIIVREERNARLRWRQYPNDFQENAELRDVLAQTLLVFKKKQVENEDAEFIYLNDGRKK